MGRRTTRLFYGFSTFVFLLYFTGSSSVSTTPSSIIDVMKNDSEICTISYLYENDIIRTCSSVYYPENTEIKEEKSFLSGNTFHCLAFYDTMYKVCQIKQYQQRFNSSTFSAYIQKFFPAKNESDKFCENIKNVSFVYAKLKPLLSGVYLNNPDICFVTCFGTENKFNQLCSMLAWRKSIDNELEASHKRQQTTNDLMSQERLNSTDNAKKLLSDTNSKKTEQVVTGYTSDSTNKMKNKSSHDNDQETTVQNDSQSKLDNPSTMLQEPEHSKKPVNVEDKNLGTNVITNGVVGSTKSTNDDIKINTISPNTEDHDNSGNQVDWNHIDGMKLPYDQNDGPEESMDTGDQNSNIPEPSEQRDNPPLHHSITQDEESHFFPYFTVVSLISIAAYVGYHNKQKILAIILEGRKSRNSRGRRRPSTANYRKLDCTLEEAVTSQCNSNVTHVIY